MCRKNRISTFFYFYTTAHKSVENVEKPFKGFYVSTLRSGER